MIQFPPSFVQLDRYPGYYWNVQEQKLYSAKSGVLKPLHFMKAFNGYSKFLRRNVDFKAGYHISVNGVKIKLNLEDLRLLKVPAHVQIFPEKVKT